MRARLFHLHSSEQGQGIVTLAMASVFLMMILAIALETGFIWMQRRDLQKAADAAALAGAQELDGTAASEGPAIATSQDYATRNTLGLLTNAAAVSDNYRVVEATVSKNADTVFASWFGYGGIEITATATARIAAPYLGGPGVVPLAIDQGSLPEPGELVTIKVSSGQGQDQWADGNFGFIELEPGAKSLCEFMVGGSEQSITDPQPPKTGNVSSMANDSCLPRRMEAALAYGCYSFDEVTDTVNGEIRVRDECNPLIGAPRGAHPGYSDTQPTSVIVFPLIESWDDISGASTDLDVVGDGQDPRTFVFFVIDPLTVESDPSDPNAPYCAKGGGPTGQCQIRGRFVENHGFTISTDFDEPIGEFDPDKALYKIIQLIE